MNIITTCVTSVLISCSLTAVAAADTMAITYRSGKVQNVVLDEPIAEVEAIGYLRASLLQPEIRTKTVPNKQTGAEERVREEPAPASKKNGFILEWAPPVDQ